MVFDEAGSDHAPERSPRAEGGIELVLHLVRDAVPRRSVRHQHHRDQYSERTDQSQHPGPTKQPDHAGERAGQAKERPHLGMEKQAHETKAEGREAQQRQPPVAQTERNDEEPHRGHHVELRIPHVARMCHVLGVQTGHLLRHPHRVVDGQRQGRHDEGPEQPPHLPWSFAEEVGHGKDEQQEGEPVQFAGRVLVVEAEYGAERASPEKYGHPDGQSVLKDRPSSARQHLAQPQHQREIEEGLRRHDAQRDGRRAEDKQDAAGGSEARTQGKSSASMSFLSLNQRRTMSRVCVLVISSRAMG